MSEDDESARANGAELRNSFTLSALQDRLRDGVGFVEGFFSGPSEEPPTEESEVTEETDTDVTTPDEEIDTRTAFEETRDEITTPPPTEESAADRETRLAAELTAAITAAETAHAEAVARGESNFDLGMLTTAMQIFGGQNGEAQAGMGGFIAQYYEAGAEIEFEIVPGDIGITSLLGLLGNEEGGPVQIPENVFNSARDMAITQIVNDPSMLASLETGNPETDTQLQMISGLISGIESPQERQEFAQNLILVLDGQTNILRINGQHQELPPEMVLMLQQQVNGIVGQTLAGGISELGGQLEGTGILGFIREALSGVIDAAVDIASNFGMDISGIRNII